MTESPTKDRDGTLLESDAHVILYVRVPPADKRRLRELADRDFDGSMAATIRYLLEQYIGARRRAVPLWIREGFLDED